MTPRPRIAASTPWPRWRPRLALLAFAALVACGGGHDAAPTAAVEEDVATDAGTASTTAVVARVNDGRLPVDASPQARALAMRAAAPGYLPTGDPNAQVAGVFGPVLPWPLMPIHQVLLTDGRVLFYGSDITGQQGGGLHYAVWDPSLGTGSDAFNVLPTVTGTDVFCAGQSLLPSTGDVLIVGGTIEVNGLRGYGTDDSNLFSASGNTLLTQDKMASRRWYPTLLTLASGDQLVLGGRIDRDATTPGAVPRANSALPDLSPTTVASYASTPELWNASTGWHVLDAVTSDDAYGATESAWYYPRAWVAPDSKVFILAPSGSMYSLDPTGSGQLTTLAPTVGLSNARIQSVMYQPGKILTVRQKMQTNLIDINGAQPVVTSTTSSTRYRQFGNATILADGQVWFSGGSKDGNVDTNDYFVSETWNPSTKKWTDGASAAVARLYHSSALLLPDATVVTGGGGDPGPFTNLNAEIYYPPYLYLKDGTGTPAPRPVITSAPQSLAWGQQFQVGFSTTAGISKVTLVRTGVVTHDFNSNQRFQTLPYTKKNGLLTLTAPASAGLAPPGYYMLFVLDGNGVPSIARIIRIGA